MKQIPISEKQIASMFDRIAPRYDMLNRMLSMSQDKRWRKHLLQWIPDTMNGSLLDVATGTGDVLLAAVNKHPHYRQFIGCDISEQMLKRAQKKSEKLTLPSSTMVQFLNMSAEKLQWPEETFDAITIAFGFRNVVHKEKALGEFRRILKKNGRLLVLEFFELPKGPMRSLFSLYFDQVLPRIGGLLSDRSAYTYLPQSVHGFYDIPTFEKKLYEHGLMVEKRKSFLFGSCMLFSIVRFE